jgi:hypothetical protein
VSIGFGRLFPRTGHQRGRVMFMCNISRSIQKCRTTANLLASVSLPRNRKEGWKELNCIVKLTKLTLRHFSIIPPSFTQHSCIIPSSLRPFSIILQSFIQHSYITELSVVLPPFLYRSPNILHNSDLSVLSPLLLL